MARAAIDDHLLSEGPRGGEVVQQHLRGGLGGGVALRGYGYAQDSWHAPGLKPARVVQAAGGDDDAPGERACACTPA